MPMAGKGMLLTSMNIDPAHEAEFNRWYEGHLPEVVGAKGFVAARLFRLDPFAVNPDIPSPYTHMAVYEFDGAPEAAMSALAAERRAGHMTLPDWFERFEELS